MMLHWPFFLEVHGPLAGSDLVFLVYSGWAHECNAIFIIFMFPVVGLNRG